MNKVHFTKNQEKIMRMRLARYNSWIKKISQNDFNERELFKFQVVVPKILKALNNISKGSYGECEDCGDLIPRDRLLAIPGALRCVECQRVFEGVKKCR